PGSRWTRGTTRPAEQAAALATARAARLGTPSSMALREWCAGLLCGDPQPVSRAAERLGAVRRVYLRARALEDLAVLHARAEDAAAARAASDQASEGYAALGATWDARRAAARLRPLGVRRRQRGPRRRPATGWAALTPA